MPIYQPGDTVRLSTTFTVGLVLTDPTAVTLTYRTPAGVETTLVYLVDAALVRDSVGDFHADIPATTLGLWTWKWVGTGAAAGIDEGDFTVEATLLGAPRLCSVDDVRAFLQKPGADTAQDDIISVLIARASRAIMGYTGRDFVAEGTNPATRTFDVGVYSSMLATVGVPIGDMKTTPTAVTILNADDDLLATITVADDLVLLPRNRPPWQPITHLRFRPSATAPSDGDVLSVTGTWGWPQIPEDVSQACIVTVGIWMRREIQAFTTTFNLDEGRLERPQALPSAAIEMLRRYRGTVLA